VGGKIVWAERIFGLCKKHDPDVFGLTTWKGKRVAHRSLRSRARSAVAVGEPGLWSFGEAETEEPRPTRSRMGGTLFPFLSRAEVFYLFFFLCFFLFLVKRKKVVPCG